MYPSKEIIHQGGVPVLLEPLGQASLISRRLTRIVVKGNEAYTIQYEAPNHRVTIFWLELVLHQNLDP
jgi:hypothetical protein